MKSVRCSSRMLLAVLGWQLFICGHTITAQELHVKVTYQHNDQPIRESVRVQLLDHRGMLIAETLSRNGEARFPFGNINGRGPYRLKASGLDVEAGISAFPFNIPAGAYVHTEYLRVRMSSSSAAAAKPAMGVVSASSLNVPADAKKEYDKGLKALRDKDLKEAKKRLEAAVTIYPGYAGALNNLGIIAQMNGDAATGDAYFEKAIALDDGYPNAYINLAKSRMVDKRLPEAEKLLLKFNSLDPINLEGPMLLTNLYVVTGKHDQAVELVRRMHAGGRPHDGFEVVHFLLGASYQTRNELAKAADEYRLYLKEAPEGQNAEAVRAALLKIEHKLSSK